MERRCKQAFSTIERLFSAWSVQSGYKKVSVEKSQVEFRDATLSEYELGSRGTELSRVEYSELAVAE
jgi:hypothetical protein